MPQCCSVSQTWLSRFHNKSLPIPHSSSASLTSLSQCKTLGEKGFWTALRHVTDVVIPGWTTMSNWPQSPGGLVVAGDPMTTEVGLRCPVSACLLCRFKAAFYDPLLWLWLLLSVSFKWIHYFSHWMSGCEVFKERNQKIFTFKKLE